MPDSLFTFIAQIVNFLIIVIVLRLLLFKRIVSAIEKRQEDIAATHKDADEHEKEAQKHKEEMEKESAKMKKNREHLMASAEEDAEKRKQEIIKQAREEVEKKREQWNQQIENESSSFINGLKESAADGLLGLSKKMFSDLAGIDVQIKMAEKLLDTIKDENSDFIEELENIKTISVKSSFSLTPDLKDRFKQEFENVEFNETNNIHGISIEAGGERIEWTIESWLNSFGKELRESINE